MQLTKALAVQLLTKQHNLVNWFDGGEQTRVTPTQALQLMLTGNHAASGSSKRVKKIVFVPKPEPKFEACYHNTQAPVLQPSIDWLRTQYGISHFDPIAIEQLPPHLDLAY
jgi:hypothetical protein